jgi:hypothetical protein
MTAEIAKIIDDGLRWYEEELWQDRPPTANDKTKKLISQEETNAIRKQSQRKTNANDDEVTSQNSQLQVNKGKNRI